MRWLLAIWLAISCTDLAIPPVVYGSDAKASACLAWVLWDEARGEPLAGARAVLDVVHTRMQLRNKNACEIVSEPHQFSGYHPGVFSHVSMEMLTNYAIVSRMAPSVLGCSYFHATYVAPRWRYRMETCKQIGGHIFYKPKEKK